MPGRRGDDYYIFAVSVDGTLGHAVVVNHASNMVLCSRLSEVVETRCLAWVLLYPYGEARVVISLAGRRHTVPDPGVNSLLRVADQTELLTRDEAH